MHMPTYFHFTYKCIFYIFILLHIFAFIAYMSIFLHISKLHTDAYYAYLFILHIIAYFLHISAYFCIFPNCI